MICPEKALGPFAATCIAGRPVRISFVPRFVLSVARSWIPVFHTSIEASTPPFSSAHESNRSGVLRGGQRPMFADAMKSDSPFNSQLRAPGYPLTDHC